MSRESAVIKSLASPEADDVDDRRVLKITAASTVPGSAPTAGSARVGHHCNGKRWLHLYGKVGGSTPAVTVIVYVWSWIADDWFPSTMSATITAADPTAVFDLRGEERVAFVASERVNADNTLDLWAGVNDSPVDQ